tara:strand:+ start:25558 stop:25788 length:231 start_codon:yes stop_codon:yes gene_type:complete
MGIALGIIGIVLTIVGIALGIWAAVDTHGFRRAWARTKRLGRKPKSTFYIAGMDKDDDHMWTTYYPPDPRYPRQGK